MVNIPVIKLSDHNSIPQLGLGLWQLTDEELFTGAFKAAVDNGYRHFDTAQAYKNEQLLGRAIKTAKINRRDLFLTTKIAVQNFGDKKSRNSFEQSLKLLETDYIDLLLLHFPVPGLRKRTWKVLEDLKQQGLVRTIGVSNFTIKHLKQLEGYANEKPAIDQVEMHIFLQQKELLAYSQSNDILIEAYSPLAHAKDMNNLIINQLAKKYNKSYAQIMLRWVLQQNVVAIPNRQTQNASRKTLTFSILN